MNLIWRGFKWQFRYARPSCAYVLERVLVKNVNNPALHIVLPGTFAVSGEVDGLALYEVVDRWWTSTYDHMYELKNVYKFPMAPFDTVPWEIHAIDDPVARKIAKRNYKRARRK